MDAEPGTRWADYFSCLLRMWRVSATGLPVWRVSLQRPGEAEQRVFADLDEMLAFLRAETAESGGAEETETEAPMG